MVWFQCEDCGEDLKKPKLPGHFRICSSSKLSCFDCGVTFGQESVQSHTQCITETEKYGPKGPGKVQSSSNAKLNKDAKQQPDVDINVGLSERPPWFCSLCNTKATSKETLLLHADGKKHRAKARAFHAKQAPQKTEECAPDSKAAAKDDLKGEIVQLASVEQPGQPEISKVEKGAVKPEEENANLTPNKKRKRKLKKHVLQSIKEADINVEEDELNSELEHKIASSSRFRIENKYVQLVAKHQN